MSNVEIFKVANPWGGAVECYLRVRQEGRQLDSGEGKGHECGHNTHLSLEMCHGSTLLSIPSVQMLKPQEQK